MVCSLRKTGGFGAAGSAITVEAIEEKGLFFPVFCHQCQNAPCVHICPSGALNLNLEAGLVTYDEKRCIGCKMCLSACPLGALKVMPSRSQGPLIKCDLCQGDPQCVKWCATGALEWVPPGRAASWRRRRDLAAISTAKGLRE